MSCLSLLMDAQIRASLCSNSCTTVNSINECPHVNHVSEVGKVSIVELDSPRFQLHKLYIKPPDLSNPSQGIRDLASKTPKLLTNRKSSVRS